MNKIEAGAYQPLFYFVNLVVHLKKEQLQTFCRIMAVRSR